MPFLDLEEELERIAGGGVVVFDPFDASGGWHVIGGHQTKLNSSQKVLQRMKKKARLKAQDSEIRELRFGSFLRENRMVFLGRGVTEREVLHFIKTGDASGKLDALREAAIDCMFLMYVRDGDTLKKISKLTELPEKTVYELLSTRDFPPHRPLAASFSR